MTVIRMSIATVTALLATEISLCAVIVYNHRLRRRKWRYNRSIKPAPGALGVEGRGSVHPVAPNEAVPYSGVAIGPPIRERQVHKQPSWLTGR